MKKLMSQLRKAGFEIYKSEDYWMFKVDGRTCVLPDTEKDDDEYVAIYMPNVVDVTEENYADMMSIINTMNRELRYIKAIIVEDGVWLSYERFMMDRDTVTEDLAIHMVNGLRSFCFYIDNKLEESASPESASPDDEGVDDDFSPGDDN